MCWSAEVSAAFAALDWTAIAALAWRGGPRDRAYALAASPIAAQEALQVVLWRHIAVDPGVCDDTNAAASLLVWLVVGFVPPLWTSFAVAASERRGARSHPGAQALSVLAWTYVVARGVGLIYAFTTGPRACTTIGPNHHQIWALLLDYSAAPWLDLASLGVYAGIPLIATVAFLRPARVAAAIVLAAGVSLPWTLLFLPTEHSSVWCWSCALLLVVALADPWIAPWPRQHLPPPADRSLRRPRRQRGCPRAQGAGCPTVRRAPRRRAHTQKNTPNFVFFDAGTSRAQRTWQPEGKTSAAGEHAR